MLKANEKVSSKNTQLVKDAVKKKQRAVMDTEVCMATKRKNYLVVSLISHYALGFNDNEIVAVPIDKEGNITEVYYTYKRNHACKVNMTGSVILSNDSKKIRLDVPGIVPSIPGTKQLCINQIESQSQFVQFVKDFK